MKGVSSNGEQGAPGRIEVGARLTIQILCCNSGCDNRSSLANRSSLRLHGLIGREHGHLGLRVFSSLDANLGCGILVLKL